MNNDEQARTALDRATRQRLAKLASRPVDTTALAARWRAEMAGSGLKMRTYRWWRPTLGLSTAAAAVLVLAAVLLLNQGAAPVVAAPAEMAKIHQRMLRQTPAAITVDSMAQASDRIKDQWSESPRFPSLPAEETMSCCLHQVGDRKVACVLMRHDQTPVTMVVAKAGDVHPMPGEVVHRGGRRYIVHDLDGLVMVMLRERGRYICLMAEMDREQLLRLADELEL